MGIDIKDHSDSMPMTPLAAPQDGPDRSLATRHAPILRFDANEPFLPLAAGYTVFRENGASPSFQRGRVIDLAPEGETPATVAIEYAIWWDWDIGHLYELEHAWVYVDAQGQVVRAEASWHGGQHDMRLDGRLALEGDHIVLFSEPGKHAFAPTPDWFRVRRASSNARRRACWPAWVGCCWRPTSRARCEGRRSRTAWRTPTFAARLRAELGLLSGLRLHAGDAFPLARALRVDAGPRQRDPRPAGRRDSAIGLPIPAHRASRRGGACARQHAAGHPPGCGARRGHGRDRRSAHR